MQPFKVPNELKNLCETYPNAEDLATAIKNGGEASRTTIARLWLSEGIPYAFRKRPALYDTVRSWISSRIDVDPKDVHLTGSARIGKSLSPQKLGKEFGPHSDLDIFVISSTLFEKLREDFNLWSYEFESKKVIPSNSRESEFWTDNIHRIPKNIARGFIDSGLIPNKDQYKSTIQISQTMYLLKNKLEITDEAPKVKGASIRCYKDWHSYVQQTTLSLSSIY